MSKFLEELEAFIKTQPFNVLRISEIHGDAEPETIEMLPAAPCQDTYSIAKFFTMTAIGLLWDRGLVSLDEKVCDILKDIIPTEGVDERWKMSTVRHALTHSLGLPGGFLDIDTTPSSVFGKDYLAYMMTYPLEYTPGESSKYSDGAFYLLSCIVQEKTGVCMDDFLWNELFYPMGFQEMAWSHCPLGRAMGGTGLYLHSSDIVKIGALYLGGGVYKGKRYLSAEWIKNAFEGSFGVDSDENSCAFYKGGMFGQKLIMVPGQNRTVVMQAFGANSDTVLQWVKEYKD